MWNWYKDRQIDQKNRIEPRNRPTYPQLTDFWKRTRFSINGAGIIGEPRATKTEPQPLPPTIYKNLKWIIDLDVRAKIIKFPKENIVENLSDLGFHKSLITAQKWTIKEKKINKLDFEIKNFCYLKGTVKKMKM